MKKLWLGYVHVFEFLEGRVGVGLGRVGVGVHVG